MIAALRRAGDDRAATCDKADHVVSIQTEVRDPVAICAGCRRLGLSKPIHGTAKLLSSTASRRTVPLFSDQATGLAVELPG